MKKIALLLAVVLVAMMAVTGCSSKKTLKMATEAGFAPYEYYEDGKIVGVDVDIANEIAKELGMELEVIDMEFNSITTSVNTGKADFGGAGMSITEERLKEVDFTVEYATSRQVVVVLDSNTDIATPQDIDGKNVGVQLGTTADMYIADEMPNVTLSQFNKYAEAVEALKIGRIDAIVMDALPAEELVAANEGTKILDGELFTDSYAFCVKKGNTEMLDAINKVLNRLIEEGKIDEFTLNHTAE